MMESGAGEINRWLAASRGGDHEATERLLAYFRPWLRVLARRQWDPRFGGKFDPSDVVQQTLVEAARDLGAFRGETGEGLAAWLRGILAHVLAHERRRYAGTQKRAVGREVSLDAALAETSARLGDVLAASGTSPAQALIRDEHQWRLAAALERLPEAYREVIELRHLEGLAHDEIARRLGRAPGATRMLWVRALARLRVEWARVNPPVSTPGR